MPVTMNRYCRLRKGIQIDRIDRFKVIRIAYLLRSEWIKKT